MALQSTDQDAAQRALSDLCEIYWMPVYSFFRRQGRTSDDAKDLVQGFFEQLITRKDFERADSERGKLRSYLLTAAKNFLISSVRRDSRAKRGGGAFVFSLDADQGEDFHTREVVEDLAPDKLYERQWAVVTLDKVRGVLAEEYAGRGRGEVFEVMGRYLSGTDGEAPYAEAAQEAEMSEEALRAGISRMRKRYRALLREHIGDTLMEGEDVDDEIRHLVTALG